MSEEHRVHRVGVLGAGQISQAAHFETCRKAKNAELYAICDVAEDLLERMSSDVECFSEKDGSYRRPLGADGHFFRRQVEGFADTILGGVPMRGANVEDGLAAVRGMVAMVRSAQTGEAVRLSEVEGGV
jgi:predicted dehydrogenase